MKIEANKSKLSLNKNQPSRPGKKASREPGPGAEGVSVEVPKKKSKPTRVKEPEVRTPAIKEPRIRVPRIRIPKIKLPSIKLPSLKVPKPSLGVSGAPKFQGKKSLYIAAVLAAVAAAAYGVLNHYFPSQMLSDKYNAFLATILDDTGTVTAKADGVAIGHLHAGCGGVGVDHLDLGGVERHLDLGAVERVDVVEPHLHRHRLGARDGARLGLHEDARIDP